MTVKAIKNRIVGHGDESPEKLLANPKNWRTHPENQKNALEGVLDEVGWVQNVIVNKRTGLLVDGHLRVDLAKRRGEKTVPVVYVDLSEAEEDLILASIDPVAALAGIDPERLDELLNGIEIDDSRVNSLLDSLASQIDVDTGGTECLTDPDDVPEPPEEPVTKLGDVWILGRHRLLCGDSTDITTVDNVLAGFAPDLCLYDPPYDMDNAWGHSYPARNIAALHDFKNVIGAVRAIQGKPTVYQFIWDCGACWWTPNRPLARHKACLIGMDDPLWIVDDATYVDGKIRKAKTVSNTRGECDYEPLPNGAVRMSTVFMRPTSQEDGGHIHSKPVDWIRAMIAGTGSRSVLDQFAGSGTGIIACEQLGIPCYSVELSGSQCDVIVKRWEDFTGKKAVYYEVQ